MASKESVVITIYCLRDAEGAVRYVGKTSNSLSRRLLQHLSEARRSKIMSPRLNWLRSLLVPPTIEVVEEHLPGCGAGREEHYIALVRAYGGNLVNDTISVETRMKLSRALKGKKRSVEIRARISAAKKGKKQNAAHYAARNRSLNSANSSGYRGVFWNSGRWRAQICVNRQRIGLGNFENIVDAAHAVDIAILKYHPPGSYLNFPNKDQ